LAKTKRNRRAEQKLEKRKGGGKGAIPPGACLERTRGGNSESRGHRGKSGKKGWASRGRGKEKRVLAGKNLVASRSGQTPRD